MSWAPTQGPSAAPCRARPLSPLMTSATTAAAASASPGLGFSPAAPRSSAGSQTAPGLCLGTRRPGREHSTLRLLSPVGLVLCVHALRPGLFPPLTRTLHCLIGFTYKSEVQRQRWISWWWWQSIKPSARPFCTWDSVWLPMSCPQRWLWGRRQWYSPCHLSLGFIMAQARFAGFSLRE